MLQNTFKTADLICHLNKWSCLHTVIVCLNVIRSCFFQFHAAIVNNLIDSSGLLMMMDIDDESRDNACHVDLNHDISIELLFYCLFDILSWAINGIFTDTKRNSKQNRNLNDSEIFTNRTFFVWLSFVNLQQKMFMK